MKKLLPRYNLERMKIEEMKVRLPSSKAVVSIPVRSAADCIVTLLTDPSLPWASQLSLKRSLEGLGAD